MWGTLVLKGHPERVTFSLENSKIDTTKTVFRIPTKNPSYSFSFSESIELK